MIGIPSKTKLSIIDTDNIPILIKYKNIPIFGKTQIEEFREPARNIRHTITSYGGTVKAEYHIIGATAAKVPMKIVSELQANPYVEYIELDHILELKLDISDQIKFNNVNILSQTIPWGVQRINAPSMWSKGNKGLGIKVCIIDTGMDTTHPDLSANYKGGIDIITPGRIMNDEMGHGTHVAGIIAANGIIAGVSPEAHLYPVKVFKTDGQNWWADISDIVTGLEWAVDNYMNIINMSLGGFQYSRFFKDVCKIVHNSGILLIAAAGNEGELYHPPEMRNVVSFPAKFFNSVIGVAAIDNTDTRAFFSSVGPTLELSAPGVEIYSTVPLNLFNKTGYQSFGGTSMASPHIVGIAALIMKIYPEYIQQPEYIRTTLRNISSKNGQRDNFFGFGIPDASRIM